ncbi:hypothetical protein DP761_23090 [Salmonella enterica subsp. enterica]|nr:hypothetical protein [Salmonella enterica subsp. enterica serovar Reading]MLO25857.1 hypothetical protein [Salmonella enterica subsp. enterica serovar Reading]
MIFAYNLGQETSQGHACLFTKKMRKPRTLARKLDYIWRSTTGNIMEQTELFRLSRGLETAKSQQWVYHVLPLFFTVVQTETVNT